MRRTREQIEAEIADLQYELETLPEDSLTLKSQNARLGFVKFEFDADGPPYSNPVRLFEPGSECRFGIVDGVELRDFLLTHFPINSEENA